MLRKLMKKKIEQSLTCASLLEYHAINTYVIHAGFFISTRALLYVCRFNVREFMGVPR